MRAQLIAVVVLVTAFTWSAALALYRGPELGYFGPAMLLVGFLFGMRCQLHCQVGS